MILQKALHLTPFTNEADSESTEENEFNEKSIDRSTIRDENTDTARSNVKGGSVETVIRIFTQLDIYAE